MLKFVTCNFAWQVVASKLTSLNYSLYFSANWSKEVVKIERTVWQTFKSGSNFSQEFNWKLFRDFILKFISDRCNCVLCFDYSRLSHLTSRKCRSPFIRQDAHCTFENCCKFKFIIHKNQDFKSHVIMAFEQRGKENHDGQSLRFRNTNEAERKDIENLLQTERPSRVYEELIDKADYEKLKAGNYNVPKSPAVIRKLKSLVSASEHFHANVTRGYLISYIVCLENVTKKNF